MPTPGDLIRRLTAGGNPGGPGPAAPSGGGGGARAVANGASMIAAEPVVQAGPRLSTFRDLVAWVGERKEAMLHAHLLHSVHLVRFAPPVIELRPQPEAPRDLSSRLAALLSEATGTRWTIAVSRRARRTDDRRTGQCRGYRAEDGRGRSPVGARDHGGVSGRAHRHGA